MNAFEQVVSDILQRKGFWTRIGYKVRLSKADKVEVGTPSMPAVEIDVLAYKADKNELYWIECKSYLDSKGVYHSDLFEDGKYASRYKIFTNEKLRIATAKTLLSQAVEEGLSKPDAQIHYWLVAGKMASADDTKKLESYFKERGWELKTNKWLKEEFEKLSKNSWDDNVTATVSKIFLRDT